MRLSTYPLIRLLLLSLIIGMQSCFLFRKEETPPPSEPFNTTTDIGEDTEDPFQEDAFEKYFEDTDSSASSTVTETETVAAEEISYDNDIPSTETFENTTTEKEPPTDNTTFIVVAGSFKLKENAERLVRQLHKLGYTDAEVVIFNEQEYHSVCAGRFLNYDEAKNRAAELDQTHNIPTYVHKRRVPKK